MPADSNSHIFLTNLLGIPALAAKVSKFLLATGELYQYRDVSAGANDHVSDIDGTAEAEDDR